MTSQKSNFDMLNEMIKDTKKVIIYGAGTNAYAPLLWLRATFSDDELQIHIAVTKKKDGASFYGYSIEQIDELKELRDNAVVMVSVFPGFFDEIGNKLNTLNFSKVFYVDTWFYRSAYYDKYWEEKIDRKKILIENFHGRGYGDSPRYIADELRKADEKLDIVWVTARGKETQLPEGVRSVEIYSPQFFYETATAAAWISNVRKYQPVLKREGQFYLQTWHGFTLKRIEKDAEEVSNGISAPYFDAGKKDSKMIDCLLSNSSFLTKIFRQTFWYDGVINEIGTPRNDIFFKDCSSVAKSVKERYKINEDSRILLYAPTFRTSYADNPIDVDIESLLDALEEKFKCRFSAMIRMHPNMEGKAGLFEYSDRIVNVTSYPDFMDLLSATDVLLTDYSSAMFDFMFSNKPIFLYAKDLERYANADRGFYIDYERLPFPIAESNEILREEVKKFDRSSYLNKLAQFIKEMGFAEDGTASQKAAELVLNAIKK